MNPQPYQYRWLGWAVVFVASLSVLTGCHETDYRWALTDTTVALPEITGQERPTERAGTPAELLAIKAGGDQTVLVAATIKDNPAKTDDERSYAFVVVLDGPLTQKVYPVAPDNGRLILNSVWRPARSPYGSLEGEIEIKEITPERIKAKCVLRNVLENARAASYIMRGTYWFDRPIESDVRLRQAGIDLK